MNNISIELEIATMSLLLPFFILFLLDPHRLLSLPSDLFLPLVSYDAMGEKKLSRNLLYELWNQVEKYRRHGDTLEFDFHFGSTNFKSWFNDHKVSRRSDSPN
jgi:hypothetical protein